MTGYIPEPVQFIFEPKIWVENRGFSGRYGKYLEGLLERELAPNRERIAKGLRKAESLLTDPSMLEYCFDRMNVFINYDTKSFGPVEWMGLIHPDPYTFDITSQVYTAMLGESFLAAEDLLQCQFLDPDMVDLAYSDPTLDRLLDPNIWRMDERYGRPRTKNVRERLDGAKLSTHLAVGEDVRVKHTTFVKRNERKFDYVVQVTPEGMGDIHHFEIRFDLPDVGYDESLDLIPTTSIEHYHHLDMQRMGLTGAQMRTFIDGSVQSDIYRNDPLTGTSELWELMRNKDDLAENPYVLGGRALEQVVEFAQEHHDEILMLAEQTRRAA